MAEQIKIDVTVGGMQKAQDELKTLSRQIREVKAAIEKASQTDGKTIGFGNSIKTVQDLYKMQEDLYKKLDVVKSKYYENEQKLINENLKKAKAAAVERQRIERESQRHIQNARANQNAQSNSQSWKDIEADRRRRTEQIRSSMLETARKQRELGLIGAKYNRLVADVNAYAKAEQAMSRISFERKKRDLEELSRKYRELSGRTLRQDGYASNPLVGRDYNGYLSSITPQVQSIRTFRQELDELARARQLAWRSGNMADFSRYHSDLQRVTAQQRQFNREIGNGTTYLGSFAQKFRSHMNWILAGGIIGAAIGLPVAIVNTLKEIESDMAGMNQVIDHTKLNAEAAAIGVDKHTYAQRRLNEEAQVFINLAAQYGEKVTDIIEAGKLWGRLYKDLSIVNTLTGQSAKLAVADKFNLVEANKALEAAMFQYGLTAHNSSEAMAYSGRIIDVWTKLAHTAGASAQDLTQAVERTGSVAKLVGVDFEFLNAMIATAVRSTGRSGAEIGNMFKSVLGSIHSDNAILEIEKLGVAVYKTGETGQREFRKVQDVLLDIMVASQGSTQNLENLFKQISGGKFQWAKASAMLGDYKEFIRTWGEAVNSTGFTSDQIGMQMDTIARKMQTLKADMDGLIVNVGNSGLTQWIKDQVDSIDALVLALRKIPVELFTVIGGGVKIIGSLYLIKGAIVAVRNAIASLTLLRKGQAIATSAETAAITANASATMGNTTATTGNAVAVGASARARAGQAAATAAGTVATGANTVATNAAATATGRLAAVTTAATGGLNLIAAAVAAAALGTYLYAESLGEAEQAERKKLEAAKDDIAINNQKVEMIKQQTEFIAALMSSHKKLTEQIDSGTLSTEKTIMAKENLAKTEEELAKLIGEEGIANLKAANWSEDACNKERIAHGKKADSIRADIKKAKKDQIDYTQTQIQNTRDRIDMMKSEVAAWGWVASAIKSVVDAYAGFKEFQISLKETHLKSPFLPNEARERIQKEIEVMKKEREGLRDYRPGWINDDINQSELRLTELMKNLNEQKIELLKEGIIDYHPEGVGGDIVPEKEPKKKKERKLSNRDNTYDGESRVSYGDIAWQEAANRIGIPYELNGNGIDSTDCGKLILDAYSSAGIDFANRYVPSMIQEAIEKKAWHPYGDGYTPQQGDAAVVLGDNHVVMADGKGGYIGASTGRKAVIRGNNIQGDFGTPTGYISVSELTGGAMVSNISSNTYGKQQANLTKMMKDNDFTMAKISADKYSEALSRLSVSEEIYGKTITSRLEKQKIMSGRISELSEEELLYKKRIESIGSSIDSEINSNNNLLRIMGTTQEKWNSMSKDEKMLFRRQRKDILDTSGSLKNLNGILNDYNEKMGNTQKKISEIRNEMLKMNFEGVFDADKVYQRKLSDINFESSMKSNALESYTDVDYKQEKYKLQYDTAKQKHDAAQERLKQLEAERQELMSQLPEQVAAATRKIEAQEAVVSVVLERSNADAKKYAETQKTLLDLKEKVSETTDEKDKKELDAQIVQAEALVATAYKTSAKSAKEYAIAQEDLNRAKQMLAAAESGGTKPLLENKKQIQEVKKEVSDSSVEMDKNKDKWQELRSQGADLFQGMITGGVSFRDSMKKIWADFANDAIRRLFQVQDAAGQTSFLGQLFGGLFGLGGGGRKKHDGGKITPDMPKMHSGGLVLEKPTLADDEVVRTLQVGERVLSKKDNQRFETLMPRLADMATEGTPMIPNFNREIMQQTKAVMKESRQTNQYVNEVRKTNELLTAMMSKMSESGGNGNVTVVSTQMSDQQILAAIQRNPRALQSILGQNRSMGHR